jgi:hypothetical protein
MVGVVVVAAAVAVVHRISRALAVRSDKVARHFTGVEFVNQQRRGTQLYSWRLEGNRGGREQKGGKEQWDELTLALHQEDASPIAAWVAYVSQVFVDGFRVQEHGVPRDRPKDSNARG